MKSSANVGRLHHARWFEYLPHLGTKRYARGDHTEMRRSLKLATEFGRRICLVRQLVLRLELTANPHSYLLTFRDGHASPPSQSTSPFAAPACVHMRERESVRTRSATLHRGRPNDVACACVAERQGLLGPAVGSPRGGFRQLSFVNSQLTGG